jgi:AcrR family transcriptional regulator
MSTRPELPRQFVLDHKRRRIMHAAAELASERDHSKITIADIVRAAGVARKTFYDIFGGREQCFARTVEWAEEEAIEAVKVALREADGSFDMRLGVALDTVLRYMAEHPDEARLVLVDGFALNPASIENHRRRWLTTISLSLSTKDELIVEGIWAVLRQHAAEIGAGDPYHLRAQLHEFVMATEPTVASPF